MNECRLKAGPLLGENGSIVVEWWTQDLVDTVMIEVCGRLRLNFTDVGFNLLNHPAPLALAGQARNSLRTVDAL